MLYKNLNTKEMYSSIPDTSFIAEIMEKGIAMSSTQLAVSAMEELIVREDTDLIAKIIDDALEKGQIKLGTSMCTMIGRSLMESCRGVDPLLQRWGKNILRGKGEYGPFAPEHEEDISPINAARIFTARVAMDDTVKPTASGIESDWFADVKGRMGRDAMKRIAEEAQLKMMMDKKHHQ